jgi:cob(I)alamin adenosyltransferase
MKAGGLVQGLVHIYTGDGKGKTSAAVGLGVRACGRGLKVLMVQFLKGIETGEVEALKRLAPGFAIYRGQETGKFMWNMNGEELQELKAVQGKMLEYASDASASNSLDLLILDEIMAAVTTGMVALKEVIELIKNKPGELEIVLTGRNAPAELVELADYVSDIKKVKHPLEKGIPARKGIEF